MKEKFKKLYRNGRIRKLLKVLLILAWAFVIAVCWQNRDKISIDGIVNITPASMSMAITLMLVLFALKSMTVVIYCGLLYVASGIVFPLPIAIAVNFFGTALMVTIPYFVGRFTGAETVRNITEKHPKIAELQKIRTKNEFLLAFFVRIIGLLPSDPISAYMGAIGVEYKKYLCGTLLGMLPSVITLPVLGMSITDPSSPEFITALSVELCVTVIAVSAFTVYKKKHKK